MGSSDIEKTSPSVSSNGCDVEATKRALPSGNVDAALEFLQTEGTAVMSALDEKKLVRKIDWMIMPLDVGLLQPAVSGQSLEYEENWPTVSNALVIANT